MILGRHPTDATAKIRVGRELHPHVGGVRDQDDRQALKLGNGNVCGLRPGGEPVRRGLTCALS